MASKELIISDSILPGPNNKIGPGASGVPSSAPLGFQPIKDSTPEISSVAKNLLKGDFGTMTPFQIGDKKYMARVEPHYHSENYKAGPQGWHKGVTVYEAKDQSNEHSPAPKFNKGRLQFLQRIDSFLNNLK